MKKQHLISISLVLAVTLTPIHGVTPSPAMPQQQTATLSPLEQQPQFQQEQLSIYSNPPYLYPQQGPLRNPSRLSASPYLRYQAPQAGRLTGPGAYRYVDPRALPLRSQTRFSPPGARASPRRYSGLSSIPGQQPGYYIKPRPSVGVPQYIAGTPQTVPATRTAANTRTAGSRQGLSAYADPQPMPRITSPQHGRGRALTPSVYQQPLRQRQEQTSFTHNLYPLPRTSLLLQQQREEIASQRQQLQELRALLAQHRQQQQLGVAVAPSSVVGGNFNLVKSETTSSAPNDTLALSHAPVLGGTSTSISGELPPAVVRSGLGAQQVWDNLIASGPVIVKAPDVKGQMGNTGAMETAKLQPSLRSNAQKLESTAAAAATAAMPHPVLPQSVEPGTTPLDTLVPGHPGSNAGPLQRSVEAPNTEVQLVSLQAPSNAPAFAGHVVFPNGGMVDTKPSTSQAAANAGDIVMSTRAAPTQQQQSIRDVTSVNTTTTPMSLASTSLIDVIATAAETILGRNNTANVPPAVMADSTSPAPQQEVLGQLTSSHLSRQNTNQHTSNKTQSVISSADTALLLVMERLISQLEKILSKPAFSPNSQLPFPSTTLSGLNSIGNKSGLNSTGNKSGLNSIGNISDLNSNGNKSGLNSIGNMSDLNSNGNKSGLNSIGNMSDLNSIGNMSDLNSIGNMSDLNSIGNMSDLNSVGNTLDLSSVGSKLDLFKAKQKIEFSTTFPPQSSPVQTKPWTATMSAVASSSTIDENAINVAVDKILQVMFQNINYKLLQFNKIPETLAGNMSAQGMYLENKHPAKALFGKQDAMKALPLQPLADFLNTDSSRNFSGSEAMISNLGNTNAAPLANSSTTTSSSIGSADQGISQPDPGRQLEVGKSFANLIFKFTSPVVESKNATKTISELSVSRPGRLDGNLVTGHQFYPNGDGTKSIIHSKNKTEPNLSMSISENQQALARINTSFSSKTLESVGSTFPALRTNVPVNTLAEHNAQRTSSQALTTALPTKSATHITASSTLGSDNSSSGSIISGPAAGFTDPAMSTANTFWSGPDLLVGITNSSLPESLHSEFSAFTARPHAISSFSSARPHAISSFSSARPHAISSFSSASPHIPRSSSSAKPHTTATPFSSDLLQYTPMATESATAATLPQSTITPAKTPSDLSIDMLSTLPVPQISVSTVSSSAASKLITRQQSLDTSGLPAKLPVSGSAATFPTSATSHPFQTESTSAIRQKIHLSSSSAIPQSINSTNSSPVVATGFASAAFGPGVSSTNVSILQLADNSSSSAIFESVVTLSNTLSPQTTYPLPTSSQFVASLNTLLSPSAAISSTSALSEPVGVSSSSNRSESMSSLSASTISEPVVVWTNSNRSESMSNFSALKIPEPGVISTNSNRYESMSSLSTSVLPEPVVVSNNSNRSESVNSLSTSDIPEPVVTSTNSSRSEFMSSLSTSVIPEPVVVSTNSNTSESVNSVSTLVIPETVVLLKNSNRSESMSNFSTSTIPEPFVVSKNLNSPQNISSLSTSIIPEPIVVLTNSNRSESMSNLSSSTLPEKVGNSSSSKRPDLVSSLSTSVIPEPVVVSTNSNRSESVNSLSTSVIPEPVVVSTNSNRSESMSNLSALKIQEPGVISTNSNRYESMSSLSTSAIFIPEPVVVSNNSNRSESANSLSTSDIPEPIVISTNSNRSESMSSLSTSVIPEPVVVSTNSNKSESVNSLSTSVIPETVVISTKSNRSESMSRLSVPALLEPVVISTNSNRYESMSRLSTSVIPEPVVVSNNSNRSESVNSLSTSDIPETVVIYTNSNKSEFMSNLSALKIQEPDVISTNSNKSESMSSLSTSIIPEPVVVLTNSNRSESMNSLSSSTVSEPVGNSSSSKRPDPVNSLSTSDILETAVLSSSKRSQAVRRLLSLVKPEPVALSTSSNRSVDSLSTSAVREFSTGSPDVSPQSSRGSVFSSSVTPQHPTTVLSLDILKSAPSLSKFSITGILASTLLSSSINATMSAPKPESSAHQSDAFVSSSGTPVANAVNNNSGTPVSNTVNNNSGTPVSNTVNNISGTPVSNAVNNNSGTPVSNAVNISSDTFQSDAVSVNWITPRQSEVLIASSATPQDVIGSGTSATSNSTFSTVASVDLYPTGSSSQGAANSAIAASDKSATSSNDINGLDFNLMKARKDPAFSQLMPNHVHDPFSQASSSLTINASSPADLALFSKQPTPSFPLHHAMRDPVFAELMERYLHQMNTNRKPLFDLAVASSAVNPSGEGTTNSVSMTARPVGSTLAPDISTSLSADRALVESGVNMVEVIRDPKFMALIENYMKETAKKTSNSVSVTAQPRGNATLVPASASSLADQNTGIFIPSGYTQEASRVQSALSAVNNSSTPGSLLSVLTSSIQPQVNIFSSLPVVSPATFRHMEEVYYILQYLRPYHPTVLSQIRYMLQVNPPQMKPNPATFAQVTSSQLTSLGIPVTSALETNVISSSVNVLAQANQLSVHQVMKLLKGDHPNKIGRVVTTPVAVTDSGTTLSGVSFTGTSSTVSPVGGPGNMTTLSVPVLATEPVEIPEPGDPGFVDHFFKVGGNITQEHLTMLREMTAV